MSIIRQALKKHNPKAVPLGGRWRRQATEGGNSLSILDCSTTSPPNPTHHANKPHYTRKAIQPRKRAPPLRALTGPPLPKGRGSYNSNTFYIKQHSTKDPKAFPLGNNKHKQNLHIRNSLSLGGEMSQRDREGRLAINIDCPTTSPLIPTHHANKIAPNAQGHTTPQASSPSPSPHGPTSPQRARLIL